MGSFRNSSSLVSIAATSYWGSTSFFTRQNSLGFAFSYAARNPLKSLVILFSPRSRVPFFRVENMEDSELLVRWRRGFAKIFLNHKVEAGVFPDLFHCSPGLQGLQAHDLLFLIKAQNSKVGHDLKGSPSNQPRGFS